MTAPYLGNAIKGWTEKISCKILTQSIVDFETVESESDTILDINLQPTPATVVDRKPEGVRAWDWWNVIIKNGPLLNIDDVVIVPRNGVNETYTIQKRHDWTRSGFRKYEAIKDYQDVST